MRDLMMEQQLKEHGMEHWLMEQPKEIRMDQRMEHYLKHLLME